MGEREEQLGREREMGLFGRNPDERTVKAAGEDARLKSNRPTMHGTHGEWNLMSGVGAAIDWGRDTDPRVHVTGEKPGGGKQR